MKLTDFEHYAPLLCPKCTHHCHHVVHLKSGFKGHHIVSDGEMHIMERDFERDEIVSMYMPLGTMSKAELEQMVYNLPPRLRHQHIYTPDEIIDIFAKCEKSASGAFVFQSFVEYAKRLLVIFSSLCFSVDLARPLTLAPRFAHIISSNTQNCQRGASGAYSSGTQNVPRRCR